MQTWVVPRKQNLSSLTRFFCAWEAEGFFVESGRIQALFANIKVGY